MPFGRRSGVRPSWLGGPLLPEHVETGLFRVTQELVNNIVKHSGATSVSVQLSRLKDRVVLLVEGQRAWVRSRKHAGTGLEHADPGRSGPYHADGRLTSCAGAGTSGHHPVPVPA